MLSWLFRYFRRPPKKAIKSFHGRRPPCPMCGMLVSRRRGEDIAAHFQAHHPEYPFVIDIVHTHRIDPVWSGMTHLIPVDQRRYRCQRCGKPFVNFRMLVEKHQHPSWLPGRKGGEGGTSVEVPVSPHLVGLAEMLGKHRLVVVLKARQVGVRRLLAAHAWILQNSARGR